MWGARNWSLAWVESNTLKEMLPHNLMGRSMKMHLGIVFTNIWVGHVLQKWGGSRSRGV